MFMSAQKCSLVISVSDGGLPWPPACAAQLTRMSMRPSAEATSATIFFTAASSPVSVLNCSTLMLLLTRAMSAAADCSAALSRATMATLTPFAGQLERDRLADAAVAAGDDGHLAFELEVHGSPRVDRLCWSIV